MKLPHSQEAIEQLPLLSHDLPPLALRDRVRTPEGWVGEVAQVWSGRDWYAVFAWEWVGSAPDRTITSPLPTFRRDELELVREDLGRSDCAGRKSDTGEG